MNTVKSFIRKNQAMLTPFFVLTRLACAYFICLSFTLLRSGLKLTDFAFFQEINLFLLCGGIILAFFFLCFVKSRLVISVMTVGFATFYCYLATIDHHEPALLFACIAVMAFIIFYTDILQHKLQLPAWLVLTLMIALFAILTLGVSTVCVLRYNNNQTSCFDFGIFAQMFYHMKETGLPMTTCERDTLLSHFAVHISPVYYLLLPVYFLFPDPRTLLIMQCVVTFSGLIPLYLLCRRYRISRLAVTGFSICYVLYPAFTGASYYYLHENNFLPPLILWLIFLLERDQDLSLTRRQFYRNRVLLFAVAFLLLGVKEDAPVYAAVIGLYFTVRTLISLRKEQRSDRVLSSPGLWIFLISVLYFSVAVILLSTKGDGAMTGRYDNYIYDGSGSLVVMLIGILKNPVYVLTQCASSEKLLFLAYMLLPLGLLPVFSKKPENWILVIPLVLFNLMSVYGYQYDIHFQYAFGSGALLIFLAIRNYASMKPTFRMKYLSVAVVSAILIYGFHFGNSFTYIWRGYPLDWEYRDTIAEAYTCIPDDASVAASTFLVPGLSQRPEIYELETTSHIPEYYAVDIRGGEEALEDFQDEATYEQIYYKERRIAIYRYKNWEPGLMNARMTFCNLAHSLQEQLAYASTAPEYAEYMEEPSILLDDVLLQKVEEDQHWVSPSEDGSMQAAYILDQNGVLIYFTIRDGEFVTTWSGPTTDERYATADGGWSGGKGAGWTGDAR